MAIRKMGGDPSPHLTKKALKAAESKKTARKSKRIVRKKEEVK